MTRLPTSFRILTSSACRIRDSALALLRPLVYRCRGLFPLLIRLAPWRDPQLTLRPLPLPQVRDCVAGEPMLIAESGERVAPQDALLREALPSGEHDISESSQGGGGGVRGAATDETARDARRRRPVHVPASLLSNAWLKQSTGRQFVSATQMDALGTDALCRLGCRPVGVDDLISCLQSWTDSEPAAAEASGGGGQGSKSSARAYPVATSFEPPRPPIDCGADSGVGSEPQRGGLSATFDCWLRQIHRLLHGLMASRHVAAVRALRIIPVEASSSSYPSYSPAGSGGGGGGVGGAVLSAPPRLRAASAAPPIALAISGGGRQLPLQLAMGAALSGALDLCWLRPPPGPSASRASVAVHNDDGSSDRPAAPHPSPAAAHSSEQLAFLRCLGVRPLGGAMAVRAVARQHAGGRVESIEACWHGLRIVREHLREFVEDEAEQHVLSVAEGARAVRTAACHRMPTAPLALDRPTRMPIMTFAPPSPSPSPPCIHLRRSHGYAPRYCGRQPTATFVRLAPCGFARCSACSVPAAAATEAPLETAREAEHGPSCRYACRCRGVRSSAAAGSR